MMISTIQSRSQSQQSVSQSDGVSVPVALTAELRSALEHARRLTALYDSHTPELAVAWDVVEELRTAISRRANRPAAGSQQPSSFDHYCSLNPEAPECRIYDL